MLPVIAYSFKTSLHNYNVAIQKLYDELIYLEAVNK